MYKRHVVVVEDEAFLRSLLADYLEQAGFLVTTAASAADARRAIKSVDPDAVVLDIDLGPGPNGLDIGEALLAHSTDIAVVYLTSLTDIRVLDDVGRSIHPRAAYLNKTQIESGDVLVSALESVLQEKDVAAYRHDRNDDRPLANLSLTQIQILKLVSEGKTNQQIADLRQRSLSATEGTISRAFTAIGIDTSVDVNSRVLAATSFLVQSGLMNN
jgi:DNA-binding NarL/FixJ family response regulator